jgi:tRNA A37 threonylcarbamoyladenosine synthetase subunit TsaC/SUA5/YrdC
MGNPILSTSIAFNPDEPAEAEMPESIALRYDNDVDIMIDGGEGSIYPSTIVDLTDSNSPEIVRQGAGDFDE